MIGSSSWVHPVRVAQVVFAIIVLGLTAYVVSYVHASSTVNFMLFNGVWTAFIATPYLTFAPIYFPNLGNQIGVLAIDAVTMIFWFAGFIALAVDLPPARYCHGRLCSSLQAATVFGALTWVLSAVTTAVSLMAVLRSNRNSSSQKPAAQTNVHTGV